MMKWMKERFKMKEREREREREIKITRGIKRVEECSKINVTEASTHLRQLSKADSNELRKETGGRKEVGRLMFCWLELSPSFFFFLLGYELISLLILMNTKIKRMMIMMSRVGVNINGTLMNEITVIEKCCSLRVGRILSRLLQLILFLFLIGENN